MTVTERPLLGNVEIQRLTDVWTEQRRNLFPNPRAVTGTGWSSAAGTGAVTYVAGTLAAPWFPGAPTTVRRGTVTTAGTYLDSRWAVTAVTAGHVYSMSGWQAFSRGGNVNVYALWKDAASATVRTDTFANRYTAVAGKAFQAKLEGLTAPANAVRVDFYVRLNVAAAVNDTVDATAAFLVEGATAGEYFDGLTASTDVLARYRWSGTANASASLMDTRRVDFTGTATGCSIRRGGSRSGLGIKTDVGRMSFTLHNDEDPLNGGTFDVGQTVRAVVKAGEVNKLRLRQGQTAVGWFSENLTTLEVEEEQFQSVNGIVTAFNDFNTGGTFPYAYAQAAKDRKAMLSLQWEPFDWDEPNNAQPDYAPINVAAGWYDPYIEWYLGEAQKWTSDIQVMVVFAPEMNDTVYPWSAAYTTPADYIAMWKHVYAIKQAVAPDVVMVWNPINYGASTYDFEDFYPGVQYIDALGLNGFNWSDQNPSSPGWQDSTAVFGFGYANTPVERLKALAGSKPWGIGMTGSAPDVPAYFQPGGKYYNSYGQWVFDFPENPPYEATAYDWITQEGVIEMLLRRAVTSGAYFVSIFHVNKETDWRISETPRGAEVLTNAKAWSSAIVTGPTATELPVFTGTVSDVKASYPLNKATGEKRVSVTVEVSDAVKVHANTPRYGAMIGAPYYETFEQRVTRLAGSALAPIEPPPVGTPKVVYSF